MSVHPDLVPILNKLQGVRNKSNGGFISFCPAHEDRTHRSLSVDWRDGKLLVKCFSGCSGEDILAIIRPTEPHETRPQSLRRKPDVEITKTVYPILGQDGAYVACHVREDGPEGKRYYWTVNGETHTLGGLQLVDLPLYRVEALRGLPRGQHVWLTEGEKAADALYAIGEYAVGTVTGASAIPSEESLRPLLLHFVTLWADNDAQGKQHMERIAARLVHLKAERPYMVVWAEAPEKGDAFDYLASGRDIADMAEESKVWETTHGERQPSLFR